MGPDAGTPYNFHGKNAMELIQYVKNGLMDPMEAIIAATSRAAKALGLEDRVGSLTPGKLADCIVVHQNPIDDIEALGSLDQIFLVFKDGKPVSGKVDTSQWSPDSPLGPG
jgi:imidazolonepropionase-like amidohydrolase